MVRKYNKKTPTAGTDATFAAGLAAAMRPMIQQIVRETIGEMLLEWMKKNAPTAAVAEEAPKVAQNGAKG